jgi:hypothetical protein
MEGMDWTDRALQVAGGVVVLVTLADVFYTVLFPASGHGPLRRPLSHQVWRVFATVGRRLPTARRRRFLAYSGPVQISATILIWVVLLVVGWAMVFAPALGDQVRASQGPTATGFGTALYYSGFTLTTLGTGDVVATTAPYRVMTVTEAALGFSAFTMALTYFLSIYTALTARKSFAAALHHRTLGTGIPVQLLVGLSDGAALPDARHQLSTLGEFLTHTSETHRSYPVLRYFHFRHMRYALPRLLLIALDAAAIVGSALTPDRYRGLVTSSGAYQLGAAGVETLEEIVPEVAPRRPTDSERAGWEARFRASAEVLRTAGVEVVDDLDEGARRYVDIRARWDAPLRALSTAMLYDWEEIDVMRP